MTATLHYRTALLLRSFRWLPPLLLHLAVMGIGLAGGRSRCWTPSAGAPPRCSRPRPGWCGSA